MNYVISICIYAFQMFHCEYFFPNFVSLRAFYVRFHRIEYFNLIFCFKIEKLFAFSLKQY